MKEELPTPPRLAVGLRPEIAVPPSSNFTMEADPCGLAPKTGSPVWSRYRLQLGVAIAGRKGIVGSGGVSVKQFQVRSDCNSITDPTLSRSGIYIA